MPGTRRRAPARRIGTRAGRAGFRVWPAWVAMLWTCGACHANTGAPVRAIDLLRELDRAEKHPDGQFEIGEHTLDGVTATSLDVPAPSRIVWVLRFPERATFHARVAAPGQPPGSRVTFRVGVSDDRIYEGIAQAVVVPERAAWTPIDGDLGAYAGWKWSLFYHPGRRTWRLVLSVDTGGAVTRASWGTPGVDTDLTAARAFARSRAAARSEPPRVR